MKYIFDFDDVLFNNTSQFKEHMFKTLAQIGIPEQESRAYYLEVRSKEFSLKKFITELFKRHNITGNEVGNVYEDIMKECPNFLNKELIERVKKFGVENCYIVTNGDKEFQEDKIKYSGIGHLFKKIYPVPDAKRDAVMEICRENRDTDVVFFDDKIRFFEDIDPKDCPNLTTIAYDIETSNKIFEKIAENNHPKRDSGKLR